MITRSGKSYPRKEEPLVSLKEIRKIQREQKKAPKKEEKSEGPSEAPSKQMDSFDFYISETDII